MANDEIEIIVSDNHSTDQTREVTQPFCDAFPGRVLYFCNDSNIGAVQNFEMALSHGCGQYLRLHNDYLYTRPGSFTEILKVIKAVQQEKPIIFLTNGTRPGRPPLEVCNSFDAFMQSVSYYSTWIAGFGLWREQFQAINDFTAEEASKLPQTDVLFRMLATGCRSIVLHDTYFSILDTGKKTGHNVAEVFGKNFVLFLKMYRDRGLISPATFNQVKREVLEEYILKNFFDTVNGFDKTGFFAHMQEYRDEAYFYSAIEDFIFQKIRG